MIGTFNYYFHKRALFQILFDLGLVLVAVVVPALSQAAEPRSVASSVVGKSLLLAVGIVVINGGLGFYQRVRRYTLRQARARAGLSFCLSLSLAGIFHLSALRLEGEEVFVPALVATLVVMLINRVYVAHATPRALRRHRLLIYGSGSLAKLVGRELKNSNSNADLVGYCPGPNESVTEVSDWALLSSGKSLTDVVLEEHIDEIIVALSERRGGSMPMRELLDCKLHGVRVVDIATYFEKTLGQIRRDSVSAGWLIFGDGFEQGPVRTVSKRIFDIVCATLLISLSLPVMLVTAILILLESGRPVLYRQERVGLNGRLFSVVKFRSMRTDAEKDGKPRWASATDDRVTRVGRALRKSRIDELPQLFSVLGGDMSMVGPRPERPYFVDQLTQELPYYAVRLSVKPGVTGWAQVRYHYGASVQDSAEKLQYDLYYVKNHSLFLDLVILFETVSVVLMRKGAQ